MTTSEALAQAEAEREKLERNKAVVRKYLKSVEAFDLEAIGECLADNVVQHYVAPSYHNDDGNHGTPTIASREAIVDEIRTCFHDVLYRKGTVTVEIQSVIAEGDFVDCRFILDAMTVRANEHYRNYYNFFYRCEDGKVAEYWEYLDSKYASKLLWNE